MLAPLKFVSLAMLLLVSLAGCRGPTELFSYIDRHCFVADWTNDHSCLSCGRYANCSSGPTLPLHERTLDLPADTMPAEDTEHSPADPTPSAAAQPGALQPNSTLANSSGRTGAIVAVFLTGGESARR